MIRQYPHTLDAVIPGETHQDDNGNWVTGGGDLTINGEALTIEGASLMIGTGDDERSFSCRAEPNNSGRYIIAADGSQIYYSWVVYMPVGVEKIPDGTSVTITWNGNTVGTGTVKRFSNGQLNSRLWL